ncbi:MAG: TolC family protein [Bacteroidetes bacterium]|nr:TolC family protein [Bacteroidota bacterium]
MHAEIEKIQANELALIRSLSQLTEVTFDTSTQFQLPYLQNFEIDGSNERKEFQLFELQKQNILANEKLITAVRKPKVAAFAQAGVGYPNPLNFFDESLSPYALGGVRFQWQFVDWKKDEKDRQLLSVQTQMIDNQKVSFERKINLLNGKFKEDVAAFENQLKRDEEIQDLQKKILLSLSSQLDNGVITVTEFIHQVNAGIQTQLNLELHKLQLIQTKVNYLTLKGLL